MFKVENNLTDYLRNFANKENTEVIDFGCGNGGAIPYLQDFKFVYEVDFSKNMLQCAQQQYAKLKNIAFIQGNLMSLKLNPVELILAVSSVMPKNYGEFDIIIKNFISNLKENGTILMICPSFESNTLLFHYKTDYLYNKGVPESEIKIALAALQKEQNYSPAGYLITSINLIQKHWLKEEILFRLEKYHFKSIAIEKLELDWIEQIKNHVEFKDYPKLWFWLITIKN